MTAVATRYIRIADLMRMRDGIKSAMECAGYERQDVWQPLCTSLAILDVFLIPDMQVAVDVEAPE